MDRERQTLGGIEREIFLYTFYICINYTSFQGNYQSHTLSTTTRLAKLAKYMYNISTLVGLPGITVTALPCTVSADCFLPADCTPFARDQYLKTGFFVCLRERERERKKERKQEMLSLLFSCVSPNAPNVPIYAWLGFGACLPVSLLLCLYIVNSYSV